MVECFRMNRIVFLFLREVVSLVDKLQFEFECILLAENCNDLFFKFEFECFGAFDFNCFPIAKYPIKIGKIELAFNNKVLK